MSAPNTSPKEEVFQIFNKVMRELIEEDLSGTTTIPTGSANSNSNAFTYTFSDGSTLTMKFSSGWKSGATTHQFTTYNGKVYIYPQSLDNSNYVRDNATDQDFDVKIVYTFTDPNGQSITQTMQWYNRRRHNGIFAFIKIPNQKHILISYVLNFFLRTVRKRY